MIVSALNINRTPGKLKGTNIMKKTFLAAMAAAALAITTFSATAQMDMKDPMVGGAAMYPSKTIVENAVNSPIHTTLVAAVKAAGLADTLNSPGPFDEKGGMATITTSNVFQSNGVIDVIDTVLMPS